MSAHDVRKLAKCSRSTDPRTCGVQSCAGIDTDLLRIGPREYAHARCLVFTDGWKAFRSLPHREILKTTVEDLRALGITLERVLQFAMDAERRDAKRARKQ